MEKEMTEWKTIDTAPKDGSWIELWRGPVTGAGVWSPLVVARWWDFGDGDDGWAWPEDIYDPWHDPDGATEYLERGDCYDTVNGFTHWRPLTEPPAP
jgi:hypothetical protein